MIIVGIAIAVGLTMFRAYVMNSNRQAVLSDLNLMSASIIAYFKTPTTQGGGVYDIEKITQDNLGQREIEAEKALNMIVLESQKAILDLKEKNLKDKTKLQLEIFLNNLSKDELERFKTAEDLKQMIMNIAVIKLEENPNLTLPDIEEIKPHIIESMFKRYIDNA